jgi:hypothetical protein
MSRFGLRPHRALIGQMLFHSFNFHFSSRLTCHHPNCSAQLRYTGKPRATNMPPLNRMPRNIPFPSPFICTRCLSRRRPQFASVGTFRTLQDNPQSFSSTAFKTSGHSRWSTIKHDKAKNYKAKSKQRVVYSDEITLSSRRTYPTPTSLGVC